jgi:hypothetical protein
MYWKYLLKDITCILIIVLFFILIIYNLSIAKLSSIIKGGYDFNHTKNELVVDLPNMHSGWQTELRKKKSKNIINNYIECMKDHYVRFIKHNPENSTVHYVIKNLRYIKGINTDSYHIVQKDIYNLSNFINNHTNAKISIAEDYTIIPQHIWKDRDHHFIRERDDYSCFYISKHNKKKYINTVIMSDDNFKDYRHFGKIPTFKLTTLEYKNDEILISDDIITPRPNYLGSFTDYDLIRITTEYDFNDKYFSKNSSYKINKPGNIWSI